MADYTKQIFEILGIMPHEEFKIKGKNNALPYLYKFTEKLETYSYDTDEDKWRRLYTGEILKDVLNGTYKIVKIPHPTAKEQHAIDYARACGCKWLAKDKNKKIQAYEFKPRKNKTNEYWYQETIGTIINIFIPISFLSWEDKEPFYIGQDKSEQKVFCEFYSEGKCMALVYRPNVACKGNKNCCYVG